MSDDLLFKTWVWLILLLLSPLFPLFCVYMIIVRGISNHYSRKAFKEYLAANPEEEE